MTKVVKSQIRAADGYYHQLWVVVEEPNKKHPSEVKIRIRLD